MRKLFWRIGWSYSPKVLAHADGSGYWSRVFWRVLWLKEKRVAITSKGVSHV